MSFQRLYAKSFALDRSRLGCIVVVAEIASAKSTAPKSYGFDVHVFRSVDHLTGNEE